ncbi:MAG: hypothetical protein ACREBR_00930 [bacterium]
MGYGDLDMGGYLGFVTGFTPAPVAGGIGVREFDFSSSCFVNIHVVVV